MEAGLVFHSSQPVCNRLKRRGHPPLYQQSGLHALYFIIYKANPLLPFLGLQTTLTRSKNIYVHDISFVFSLSSIHSVRRCGVENRMSCVQMHKTRLEAKQGCLVLCCMGNDRNTINNKASSDSHVWVHM